jgi:hypothetical protein
VKLCVRCGKETSNPVYPAPPLMSARPEPLGVVEPPRNPHPSSAGGQAPPEDGKRADILYQPLDDPQPICEECWEKDFNAWQELEEVKAWQEFRRDRECWG